ncbi:MAG: TIGR03087 family PEP-CTERM/XrtA system glycosyltransferase [Pseudomonadota bacterium]|nr:TIGR03087 family PEP-CTERM/XrtA system glycosyltransferase [Pseudomonadota bacterium]
MGDILFLAHRVPFPPNRGDKIRSANLLRKLATLGRVHVGCFAESAEDFAGVAELETLAATKCVVKRSKPLVLAGAEAVLSGKPVSLTAFYSAQLQQWVCDSIAGGQIDTIVVFSGQMGQYVPDGYNGRVIVDLCDVDSAKFENYAAAGDRVWLNVREGRLLAIEEERLARRADITTLISQNEAALFRSRLCNPSDVSVEVLGNGIDAESFDPSRVEPHPELLDQAGPHFVFTGQMDYRPNESAALWAIEKFVPVMRAAYPDGMVHIVGRNPTPVLTAHDGASGVRVWGEVPDVKPFLAGADCVIAPLLIARGVQNKVLEAMAMARPVMLTNDAATGIAAKDGEHLLIANADPAEMLARFEALEETPDIGAAARQFVLEHHAWNAMLAPLSGFVNGQQEARNAA